MKPRVPLLIVLFLLPITAATLELTGPVPPAPSGETVATAALVEDGMLYVASYESRDRAGHLRAFALAGQRQTRLWDAAEGIPSPGAAEPPPVPPDPAALVPHFNGTTGERLVFTNLDAGRGSRLLTFDARAAHALQPQLGVSTLAEAAALINAVRGRLGTSAAAPAGTGDRPNRLGAISRSSPALVGASPLAGASDRDRVLFVGGEDGMLHAILVGRRATVGDGYDHLAEGCGRELWAFLPGSLLPALNGQLLPEAGGVPAVHVDGAPAVSDLFFDSDGDGRREWRTVLVGTACAQRLNRGSVFALDVTDPHAPRLLWESSLAELAPGRSRGAALGRAGGWDSAGPQAFLTFGTSGPIDPQGAPAPNSGSHGVLACALDLADGRLMWRFAAPYAEAATVPAEPPSIPSLLMADDGGPGGVVFGDLAGRLWVLDPQSGLPRGGGPLWQTPGGVAEPIGAGLAVRNRLVLFGTGGVDSAANRANAVYAVEILAGSARLLWSQPLARGETLWGAPSLDRFGRSYLGVGGGGADSPGRLLVIAADGTLSGSVTLAGPPPGGPIVMSGAVVTVSRTGQVEQHGESLAGPFPGDGAAGRVKVLSWRVR